MSEAICERADEEAVAPVDAEDVADVVDDEAADSSADSRLARSVANVDSRLEALDELDDELESLALDAPDGGGPEGGPPAPPGPPLAELWLPLELVPPSCDRKLSTAADSPTAVAAFEIETALLADALEDEDAVALALDWPEPLLWLACAARSSCRSADC